jgi:hypothetical protein
MMADLSCHIAAILVPRTPECSADTATCCPCPAAAALQQLRNEMGSAESNDGRDEYERTNSGLPPNASRSNGRAASAGSGDLVQELIERNSRTTEELKDMQVMVDEQAAALKHKNGALVSVAPVGAGVMLCAGC